MKIFEVNDIVLNNNTSNNQNVNIYAQQFAIQEQKPTINNETEDISSEEYELILNSIDELTKTSKSFKNKNSDQLEELNDNQIYLKLFRLIRKFE